MGQGANLAYSGYPRKTGEIVGRHRCQAHVSKESAICSSHVVYENMLEEIIINDIRVAGMIPDEMFRKMSEEFNSEKAALQKEQENIYAQLEEHRDVAQDFSAWLALVKKHEAISALKRPIALELIESIKIKESFPEGSKRHLEIWINYRFIGNIQEKTERNAMHSVPLGSIAS